LPKNSRETSITFLLKELKMKINEIPPNRVKHAVCAIAVGLCLVGASSIALADNYAYSVAENGTFGATDLDTGTTNVLGTTGLTLGGLGSINNTLYGTGYGNDNLYSINTSNGAATLIGASNVSYDSFGSTSTGLYAFGDNDNLYSINPDTGAATLIGPTGLTIGAWRGLSTDASSLYYAQDGSLYTLNTSTGAATLVSNHLGASIGEMVGENGALYGVTSGGAAIDTINLTTGTATAGPNPNEDIWGLSPLTQAPVASVPEPATTVMWLFGTALTGFIGLNRKKSV
jgi:hypothetical protein